MNESALNTEIRLPRQVKERADRARAATSTPNPDEVAPSADPPVAAVEPPAPTPAATVDPRENDPVYWKQRFKVTEGMWKRDKDKFARDLGALQNDLQAAAQRIRELESKGAASNEDVDLAEFFTAEEVETLGEEQARIQARAILKKSREIAGSLIKQEVEPLKRKQQQDQDALATERQNGFLTALTELQPNWQEVNKDARWIEWLEMDDPQSGVWRQTILDAAQDRGDAARVAKMIQQWEAELNAVRVPSEPTGAPQGHPGSSGQSGAGTPPTAKGVPTPAEIRDFYKRKALGKVRESEATEFNARIAAAQAAGYL